MARKMKDSGIEWIGEIPEDWEIVKIKYISKVNSSGLSIEKLLENGKYKIYDANKLVGYSDDCYIKEDYISIIKDGAGIGRTRIMPKNTNIIGTMNAILARNIELFYLYYFLNIFDFNQFGTGSTIPHIYFKEYGNNHITFPSKEIQQRIVVNINKKIKKINDIKKLITQEIQTLEAYKKSIITEAVTKGLDKNVEMKDSGIEWIGEIPKHWEVIKLKHASVLKGRIGWQGLTSDEYIYEEDLPYLVTGTDFINGYIDWNNCARVTEMRYEMDRGIQVKESDLLIIKDGTIGKLAISKNCPEKATLNSGVFLIRNNGNYKYVDKYMYYLLQSEQFYLWFELNESGNSTIRHLYQKDFYEFKFTYPVIIEQQEIVTYLDNKCKLINDSINQKQDQLEILEDYKKSLIYEYVTGKKEVPHG